MKWLRYGGEDNFSLFLSGGHFLNKFNVMAA